MFDSEKIRAAAEAVIKARDSDGSYTEYFAACDSYNAEVTPETVLALLDEIERLREMLTRIPQTPQQMIDFIGSNFNSQSPFDDDGKLCGDLSMVTYSLSVHDLLSAFSWADLDRDAIDAAKTQGART